ncbi:MAG: DNA mismatch repair protein MutS [Nanoarchaeota archaeon]|nr:DNA mismatch repair protein MutS [Nanoarchaeota archaeon]
MKEGIRITPMMQQFLDIKEKHPDCILFFRAGDYYELFYDDAKICSEILNITLTKRGDVPMAGVPFHSVNPYIKKVLEANKKIAICEQLEDPKQAKGVVKRGVTQILTPGTIIEDEYFSTQSASYIACVSLPNSKEEAFGIVLLDISTGECIGGQYKEFKELKNILQSHTPSEILYPEHPLSYIISNYANAHQIYSSNISIQRFHTLYTKEIIKKHFKDETQILQTLETKKLLKVMQALGAVLYYSKALKHQELEHIQDIQLFEHTSNVVLESLTLKNLDIISSSSQNSKATLLHTIDFTKTPLGKREIKKRLISPLKSQELIEQRLKKVEFLEHQDPQILIEIREKLSHISDIERIYTRISSKIATPKDLKSLQLSLEYTNQISNYLNSKFDPQTLPFFSQKFQIQETIELLNSAIVDEPPSHTREAGYIKQKYSKQRDELEQLSINSSEFLTHIESRLKKESQITNLKIKYNKIFGYYIEIPKSQEQKVTPEFILKQTLVNANRYTTPELKEKEQLILGAKEKLSIIEQELYEQLLETLQLSLPNLKLIITELKSLDVAQSSTYLAKYHNYTKPQFTTNNTTTVLEGRNPIIERFVSEFVSNDYEFIEHDYCKVITGPNMAGKSTFLRQVALISILAQCGFYVPAKLAKLKIYDSIFTRIGAHDNLSENESTFMVEMSESAHILHTATHDSLIILDEIGRGTSTYDGMAIAQAIIEDIAQKQIHTLFATHYHELNELEHSFQSICNYHIEVEEKDNQITFLHKIKKGGVDNSYGIHVAKLANMPQNVLNRAEEILDRLEENKHNSSSSSLYSSDTHTSKENLNNSSQKEYRKENNTFQNNQTNNNDKSTKKEHKNNKLQEFF